MIVTADWLVPISGRPIRDGAVMVRGSRIEGVGTRAELRALFPGEAEERFPGCTIMPGLVNAHTHLSLTVLGGVLPRLRMRPFLAEVTKAVLAMSDDDLAASASLGAHESLACGVTTVGDIVYGPEALAACGDAGLGGVFYWEVLGIDAGDLSGELAEREFPSDGGSCATGRTRCAITPHTPYTSGPELLKAARNVARAHQASFAIHVSESRAERELMVMGTGPLAETSRRLALGFRVPHVGSVPYLDGLGVLDGAVAVHCVDVDSADISLLKRRVRGVVVCPRSNEWLDNGTPPIGQLSSAGVRLALGTDSTASCPDLDLFAEARAAREIDRGLSPRRLLAMMTADGARVLGLDGWCGAIAPGLQADLTLVETGATTDPEGELIARGGRSTVHSVLAAGIWRVRDGGAVFRTSGADRAAERARETVRRALGS